MIITSQGRTASCCYSLITVVRGCLPLFKWEEMVVESGIEKKMVDVFKLIPRFALEC